ncbi:MAG: flavodoxin family protein [Methanobrevibacter sp.]|nr:flavodoxin family protein [Methanobrevibacter sp.]
MKALFINGGPRKKWSTYQMLEKAMEGAKEAGAEVEFINLYDYDFKGCKSCFACKLKNAKTNGLCAIKDDLTPILENALNADVLVMASPVYFYFTTGVLRAFMERLMFPVLSYNPKVNEKTGEVESSLLNKTVPTAMIYTTGAPEEEATHEFKHALEVNKHFLEILYGYNETLYSHFTYQFKNYSKYDLPEGLENLREKQRDEQFPKDLQKAFELGKRLVEKAKEFQQ